VKTALILLLLLLAGCQTVAPQRATVIAPNVPEEEHPQIEWVKRGNVLYLELHRSQ